MLRSLSFRACALAAVVSLAFAGLIGALAFSTRQTRDAFAWIDHTQRVLATVDHTTGALRTAESAQRGFVLTRDPTFLAGYDAAMRNAGDGVGELVRLTADNADQHARALALRGAIGQRMTWLSINLDRARGGDFAAAEKGIATGKGRQLMDQIEATAERMRGDERVLMSQRAARFDRLVTGTGTLLTLGGALIFALLTGFVVLAVIQVRRPTRAIIAAMQRLEHGELYDVYVAPDQGSAEFTAIADGYNALASRLSAKEAERREAEARLQQSNASLAASAADADRRGAAIEKLAGMAHRMQAARTDEEMALVIGCFVPQVLPGTKGLLYAFNNSRNQLTLVAGWGGHDTGVTGFAPTDCWALRRGQSHAVPEPGSDVVCEHVHDLWGHDGIPYHCEPLLAGGDVVGLLQLEGSVNEADRFMLNALAENIASALVNHRLQRGLREQTIRDPLTALYNRRYMEETLGLEIARVMRDGAPLSVVMCDVDHFKRFNDDFGHGGGDAVLQAVAAEMARHFRDGDVVCRYGGEEFAIVAPGATPEAVAGRVELLREAIARLAVRDGGQALGSVTMSFGVAGWSGDLGSDAGALISRADASLYRAKREGRNRTVVDQPGTLTLAA